MGFIIGKNIAIYAKNVHGRFFAVYTNLTTLHHVWLYYSAPCLIKQPCTMND